MKIIKIFFLFLSLCLFLSCGENPDKSVFIASCPPVAFILQEISGGRVEVVNLLQPGESPHTFSPTPSTLKKTQNALTLFYVSGLLDEWAVSLPVKNKVKLIDLIEKDDLSYFEESENKIADPHFFTDPIAVKNIVLKIARLMAEASPENKENFLTNADNFIKRLLLINKNLESKLSSVRGKKVVLFHPSFVYFLKRYGLVYSGSVESSPGKEPTAAYLSKLIEKLKTENIKVLFSETELPEGPALALADALKARVFQLDPLGGVKGRSNYEEYINYNADIFLKALK